MRCPVKQLHETHTKKQQKVNKKPTADEFRVMEWIGCVSNNVASLTYVEFAALSFNSVTVNTLKGIETKNNTL